MIFKKTTRKIGGITLLETLLVMSIGIIFIGLSFGLYKRLMSDINVRIENENISYMYEKLNVIYGKSKSGSLNNDFAIKTGIVPKNMIKVGADIRHSWNDSITLSGSSDNDGEFRIKYLNVPAGFTCSRLMKKQSKLGWDSAFVRVKIDFMNYNTKKAIVACNPINNEKFIDITFIKGSD